MSSSLGLLAYVLDEDEDSGVTDIRVDHARQHLQNVHKSALVETRVGDNGSGLIGWQPTDQQIAWEAHSKRGAAATSWLHIPALAGGPESDTDPWALADEALRGAIHPAALGTPFAVARWADGQLELMNDVLGLVRLFHYRFDGGDVWTTRQGLAHIFMGVPPERNPLAWAGMATIGWAPNGVTQLGFVRQLPGGTKVVAWRRDGAREVSCTNGFADWLDDTRSQPRPPVRQNVRDMEQLMATARRWPAGAIADLSGGKDSRVGAALGIRSRSIVAVRTINTDPGEVATARQLMSVIGDPIPHMIEDRKVDPSRPQVPLHERLASKHEAFEGRYLAATAFATRFNGFRTAPRPRFNGLGGEVLAGGNFASGRWRDKMMGAPVDAARDRMARMVRAGVATSVSAQSLVTAVTDEFVGGAQETGAKSAGEVLDLFYCRDRMPNWSVTFATPNFLCPLFAPSVLALAMHSLGAPQELGLLHRELVREAMPAWDDIPYYTPSFATRTSTPVWAGNEWSEIKQLINDRMEASDSFDQQGLRDLLSAIEHGTPGKSHEVAIMRFLWEQTFDSYVEAVAAIANRVRQLVDAFPDNRIGQV